MRVGTARDQGRREQRAGDRDSEETSGRIPELRSGPWLLPGHDGRLLVYALADQAVLRWTEERQEGPGWPAPDVLPAPDVTRLTVAQGANRYAHLLGRRVREKDDGRLAVDLVYAIQYQA